MFRRSGGALLFVSLTVLPELASAQPFHVAPVYQAPTPLRTSLVSGDLNQDGWPDLVGSDRDDHVTVFLNDGTGKLAAPSLLTAGSELVHVDIADFNSDSNLDLVAADVESASGLWLFLGDGNGGFAPAVSLDTGPNDWVASLDLNDDGNADLLTGTWNPYTLTSIIRTSLGNDSGQFTTPTLVFTYPWAGWPRAADFNGDGKPDLAVAGEAGVWIRLGDGAGGFGPPALHQTGGLTATDVALDDFDADGKVDLVASTADFSGFPNWTYFLPGDGAGGFGIAVQSPGVALSPPLLVGDLNEDGKLDLGAGASLGVGAILGDGAGHFATGSVYISGAGGILGGPALIVDVDRDSHLDLLVAGLVTAVLRGDGAAHFDALEALPLAVGFLPELAVGDFNEDGRLDLGVSAFSDDGFVLLGDGQGGFSTAGAVAGCPNTRAVGVGDFNGDFHLDLVGRSYQQICVFLGDGTGSMAGPVTTSLISEPWFAVADFNEDGRSDLVASQGQNDVVSILLSNGLGGFGPPVNYLMNTGPGPVVAGDWNGDSHADVASWGGWSQDLSVRLGDGLGALGPRMVMLPGTLGGSTIVGDWNDDGAVDLAVGSGLAVLGDGAGGFSAAGSFPPGRITAADFDQDGLEDVASISGSSGQVPNALLVSHGDGTGDFGLPWSFHGTPDFSTVAAGDFNSDGRPDIIVAFEGALLPFLSMSADLSITVEDGQASAVPGAPISYLATLTNLGPRDVPAATLTPTLPSALLDPAYSASTGVYDPATGLWTGLSLGPGESAVLTLAGTVDPSATGTLSITASVAPPPGYGDPNAANDSATDVDTLTPQADLGVHLSDLGDPASPGAVVVYEARVDSAGPSVASDASFSFDVPPGAAFLSSTPGAPTCAENAGVVNCTVPSLAPGQSATFVVSVAVGGVGVVAATAVVVGGTTPDPDTGNNLAAEATNILLGMRRELVRGSTLVSGVDAAEGLFGYPGRGFRARMPPRSSWEVVVDGVTGDLGGAAGPILQWVDDENGVHASGPAGVAFSRSLRIENPGPDPGEGYVRVVSTACVLNCGPDDVFRISARETTLFGARFNNSATQTTVIVLQSSSAQVVSGHLDFHDATGAWLHGEPITLGPHQSLALAPSGIPAIQGQAGSVSFSHDGRLGAVSGKASAVEPATGLTFDTPLAARDH